MMLLGDPQDFNYIATRDDKVAGKEQSRGLKRVSGFFTF